MTGDHKLYENGMISKLHKWVMIAARLFALALNVVLEILDAHSKNKTVLAMVEKCILHLISLDQNM